MSNVVDKNPISVINEFCLRTNSKVFFEFGTDGSEFVARVTHNGQVIGEGKDKKKQVAKTKAAEAALIKLSAQNPVKKSDMGPQIEKELGRILIKLGKKGSFRLSFQDPLFVYQYFIGEKLIAEGKCVTEPSAKLKCSKKVLNKLKPLIEQMKPTEASQDPQAPSQSLSPDSLNSAYLLSLNLKTKSFLDSKISGFELSPLDKKQIFELKEEVFSISSKLNLVTYPLGSLCLNILRSCNKTLDYCIVLEQLTDSSVYSVFEAIESIRSKPTEPKDPKVCSILTSSIELHKNESGFYSQTEFIRLTKDGVKANLYFYDSNIHPSLLHYKTLASGALKSTQLITCVLLRQWKRKLDLPVPIELLDLLVIDYTLGDQDIQINFRTVLELLAGGIYLPGSSRLSKNSHHEFLLPYWPLQNRHLVMAEALRSLISFSQGEAHLILS